MRNLLFLLLAAACATEEASTDDLTATSPLNAAPHSLRIATFNIHGGIPVNPDIPDKQPGHDLRYEYLALDMAQIRSANADVVLLQEVHNHSQFGGCDDQPTRLRTSLQDLYPYWDYAPDTAQATFSCGSLWSWTAGQMILSKLPLSNVQNTLLEDTTSGIGDVYAQHATIVKDGVAFHIYNTHFSSRAAEIVYEFEQLRNLIDQTVGDAVVVAAGDFNWDQFFDPGTQAPMANRPLFHHGENIDHLWSDWPSQNTEVQFAVTGPVSASDHPLTYWDLSWVGDNWITAGQKRAWAFGMSGKASSSASGNIYGRNNSIPARVKKTGITTAWAPDNQFGNPALANPGFSVAPANDADGCEFVGWRDTSFKWSVEAGPSCTLSTVFASPTAIASSPAVSSFVRTLFFGGTFYNFQNYFVFTNMSSGGTFAWAHYEGTSPAPGASAFSTWNVHTDGAAHANSSPAVVSPSSWASYAGCSQLFIRDQNDRLDTKSLCYDGSSYSWSGWTFLDRPSTSISVASSPSAAGGANGVMHACIVGTDAQVWCKTNNGYPNYAWDSSFRSCGAPPGGAVGDPSVTVDGADLLVYVRGPHDRIFMRRCNHL